MDVKSCAVDWNWRYLKYSQQYLENDLINTMQQVSNAKNVKMGFSLISTKLGHVLTWSEMDAPNNF